MSQTERLNIVTLPIADKVHRHVLASHYLTLLEALQTEAGMLGYYFAKTDTSAPLPSVLADVLAEAVARRKEFANAPKNPQRAWQWAEAAIAVGFGDVLRDAMLSALEALGLRLQAAPEAAALIQAENARRLEAWERRHQEAELRQSATSPPPADSETTINALLKSLDATGQQENSTP